jgi:hypothetical protein
MEKVSLRREREIARNSSTYRICDKKMDFARMLQHILLQSGRDEFPVNISSIIFSVRYIKSRDEYDYLT